MERAYLGSISFFLRLNDATQGVHYRIASWYDYITMARLTNWGNKITPKAKLVALQLDDASNLNYYARKYIESGHKEYIYQRSQNLRG